MKDTVGATLAILNVRETLLLCEPVESTTKNSNECAPSVHWLASIVHLNSPTAPIMEEVRKQALPGPYDALVLAHQFP